MMEIDLESQMRRDLLEHQAYVAEQVRVERWHATYNAALPECMTWEDALAEDESLLRVLDTEGAHKDAAEMADRAHGPLVKP